MIRQISNYKLLRKLGEGGMGEVYFAEDERLSRKVALKILPENIGKDRKNLSRFMQEARLAANLNHPNICTIYEVSEADESPLLAMELVEGETLAEKIRFSDLELFDILRITTQIADALDEAHRNGVIHRDIKASNIIINHRGQVKILDFGLAKTISTEVSEEDITRAKTEDGMLVGTVQYMSPEQALGKPLDGRTDLWSLGVLLYEMVCRTVPFKASTQAGIFDEILNKDPLKPSESNEEIPEELENIILKLLEKDLEMRYQTASDLLADLKRLRRNLGESFESEELMPISTSELRKNKAVVGVKQTSWFPVAAAVLAVMVLGGIALMIYSFAPKSSAEFSFADAKPTRITNLGKVLDATVSDDGKYIAYVLDEGEKQSLWLKQTENGGTAQIVPAAEVIFQGIEISSDGNWLYYNVWDKVNVGEIFRVPVLGGVPQLVIHDCMPGLTLSPDNQKIVFIRSIDETQSAQLVSATVDGKNEKVIYETFPHRGGIYSMAFAPDGKTLAMVGNYPKGADEAYKAQIAEMPAEGGELKIIWEGQEENIGFASSPQWLPDKSGLLVSLANGEITNRLWLIDYADGTQTPINTDLNSYDSLSITADGKKFVGVERDFTMSVWTLPFADPDKAERITDGKIEGAGVDWTPDNEIVYSSIISGKLNIWKMSADGSEKKQLTNDDNSNVNPCVSLDGKTILFGSNKHGLRTISIDGKPIDDAWKKGNDGNGFDCMRSENAFLYYSTEENNEGVAKYDLDAKKTVLLLKALVQQMQISPDGKKLFYTYWDEEKKKLASEILDFASGRKQKIELPASAINNTGVYTHYLFNWTQDSQKIAFVDHKNGVSNIWLYSLKDGKQSQLTNFKDYRIQDFSISHDGKQIVVSRGSILSDVVLFRTEN